MPIDFPSNPTNGQVYSNWIFDSSITAWRNVNTDTGIGTLNAMGLKNVVPTSVVVGSGSATTNANCTVTFSGATSISLNNIFSSTYSNYRIIFSQEIGTATTTDVLLRFRASGSDVSSSSYYYNGSQVDGSTVSGYQAIPTTYFYFGFLHAYVGDTHASVISEIQKPYRSKAKTYLSQAFGWTGASAKKMDTGGFLNVSGLYDGMTIYTSNGTTFGGTISVYGYTN
jgi:hypothetical protein